MDYINISKEDLELMNYNDIAHIILEKYNKKMKINDLFSQVCNLLELDEDEFVSHIADFFELLSTDKRFIMLEDGYWDLKIKHNKGMIIDEDEEDDEILDEESDDSDEQLESEDIYDVDSAKNEDDDIEEDDLSDLVILDDIEDESNM